MDKRKAETLDGLVAMRDRARVDPVWFAENILQLRPLPGEHTLATNSDLTWEQDAWQRELLEACADVYRKLIGAPTVVNHDGRNYITVRAPQGPGKTFGVAVVMHWFNFCFPGLIAATAPKLDQVKEQAWREFRKIQHRALGQYASLMRVDAEKITWGGKYSDANGHARDFQWLALARTGSQPENMMGLHDQHILFLVDEATGVNEEIYPVIFGALSTGFLRILVLIANPTKRDGMFAKSHLDAGIAQDYYRMHISLDKTLRVKRPWVDQMVRTYGPTHPAVLVRCYGEFAEVSDNQLIALGWIERARNRDFDVEKGDGSIPKLRVTVDVADGGDDETVISVARHFHSHTVLLKVMRHNYPAAESPVLAAREAVRVFRQWGGDSAMGDDIVVDANGVGAGTAGTIMRDNAQPGAEHINVIAYRGGEASDAKTAEGKPLYRCRRVQSYIALRNAFRDDTITLAPGMVDDRIQWGHVEAQLTSIKRKPEVTKVEDLQTKEEMKREGIKSPDIADALAMQYATTAPALSTHQTRGGQITTAIPSTLLDNY